MDIGKCCRYGLGGGIAGDLIEDNRSNILWTTPVLGRGGSRGGLNKGVVDALVLIGAGLAITRNRGIYQPRVKFPNGLVINTQFTGNAWPVILN